MRGMRYIVYALGWIVGATLVLLWPGRLLITVGVLLFAACSIALVASLGGFVWRWLGRQRRGVRWTLAAAVLLLAGVFLFQRLKPAGDQARIEDTITAVFADGTPTYCETKVTFGYLEQITGAKPPFADNVCRQEATTSRARSADTTGIAIDGDNATALVALRGGSFDGSRLAVGLREEEGSWRVNRLLAFRHFDRDGFERAYRRSFLEFGSPVRSVDCATGQSARFTNADIEHAALTDIRGAFTPIAVSCDRDGIERSLVKAAAEPKYGLPQQSIRCAARKAGALSDAGLTRVVLSPLAYDELLYSCGRSAILAYQEHELKANVNLDAAAVRCVLGAFRGRPTPAAIRLGYDERRYNALIATCRG